MTTHEKTRLIELLCSGDEVNILLAKEICEQQCLISCIKEAYELLKKENYEAFKGDFSPNKIRKAINKVHCFEIVFSSDVWKDIGYVDYLRKNKTADRNWQIDECMQQYYSKHLQSSE